MASSFDALGGGLDGEDESKKQERLAARAARFNKTLPGNKYKELEKLRSEELKAFVKQGLIKTGKTDLGDAVDMRGTCEGMCSGYEIEFREYTKEIHPFEARPDKRMDHSKAVAAYTRSDAGAGMGDAAILPSDLRTPAALVRSLDYLINSILTKTPPPPSHVPNWRPTERKALGYSAGFIRDRTRAIRKEFAMQSSWGHDESIGTFERIARWHILCLRELQEESGMNKDMHIDSAELGRCFTSLRQHYNDRREELGVDMPYSNEPEFRAYMLLFDLSNKSVSIPTAELPSIILDHPLVQIAWELRKAAQRNFDSQKEGSKLNSELGSNLISSFVKVMRRSEIPYLMSCLCEIRLREMRRSALRALTRTYPRLRTEPIRYGENGQVVERKMVLIKDLVDILGCEEQEDEPSAWDGEDVMDVSKRPEDEAVNIVKTFGFEVYADETGVVGALINQGALFNDNQDAPFTRRWKSITAKKGNATFGNVINGKAGVAIDKQVTLKLPRPQATEWPTPSYQSQAITTPSTSAFSLPSVKIPSSTSSFSFNAAAQPFQPPIAALPTAIVSVSNGTTPISGQSSLSPSVATIAEQPKIRVVPQIQQTPAPKIPIPTFFPSPAEAGPSKPPTTAALPRPSPTTSVKRPRRKSTHVAHPPNSASTTGPRRNSLLRNSITAQQIEDLRQAHERVLPVLADMMLDSVIAQYVKEITPDLSRTIKQESAARDYSRAKSQRNHAIKQYASRTFDALLENETRNVVLKAVLTEIARRFLIRRCVRHWKSWARSCRMAREEARRDREEIWGRLKGMGLGGGSIIGGSANGGGGLERSAKSVMDRFDLSSMSDRMDEFEIDNALQQAERAKDRLFAPSTFLTSIARHVAQLLCPASTPTTISFSSNLKSYHPVSIVFHTLLSVSADSGTPSDQAAGDWLKSKLAVGDGDELTSDGVTIASDAVGRYDDLPVSTYVGLIIFEVPLRTIDSRLRAENIADAQDRMVALSKTIGQGNRYTPAFLFLVWEDESMEEIIERLEISDDVAIFSQVGVASLEETQEVDARFSQAVARLLPTIEEKTQVVIRLQDVLFTIQPSWQKFLTVLQLILDRDSYDGRSVSGIFEAGLSILNELPTIIKKSLGSLESSIASTFSPIKLPSFSQHSSDGDFSSAVNGIRDYLGNDLFFGLDDLALCLAPLHQASLRHRAPPLQQTLQALAFFTFGEMRNQLISLDLWPSNPIEARKVYESYLKRLGENMENYVENRIEIVTRLQPVESEQESQEGVVDKENVYESHAGTVSTSLRKVQSVSDGLKSLKRLRSRSDGSDFFNSGLHGGEEVMKARKTESKAWKNAKLLRALEKAQRALERTEF